MEPIPPSMLIGRSDADRQRIEAWWASLDETARQEMIALAPSEPEPEASEAPASTRPICTPMGLADRVEGGILGLLVGDAMGVPYEFHDASSIPPLHAIEPEPPAEFRRSHAGVPPGTWSDDGAQALCLLASLVERGTFDLDDFADRLVRWRNEGYLAVDGRVFDIGIQTDRALEQLAAGVPPTQSGPADEHQNGNGSLMRVLPLALWHQGSDEALFTDAMRSSLPTHGHLRSQLCCGLYCLWTRRILQGRSTEDAWSEAVHLGQALSVPYDEGGLEFRAIDPHRAPAGGGSGYVVDCLHSARLALEAGPYEGVIRSAIALGTDTDTTAAVAGGIAGVREGALAIPDRWLRALRGRPLLDPLLDPLLERVGG